MSKSGYCMAPLGAAIPHGSCRWSPCSCECHGGSESQQNKGIRGKIGAQDGPEPLATIRGRDRLSRSQSMPSIVPHPTPAQVPNEGRG